MAKVKDLIAVINRTPQTRLEFCNQVVDFKGKIEASFLELGRRLWMIREHRLYGDSWESFEDYLMELKNISLSTATKLINIYMTFVVEYDIPVEHLTEAGGWTMLAEPLALIHTKEDAMMWVEKARVLTRSDLRREIQEAKTGKLMKDCKHNDFEQLHFRLCKECGVKERVYTTN